MLKLLMKMIVNINKWKDFIGKNIVYYIINYSIFNAKILKYKILRNSRINSILLEKKENKNKKVFWLCFEDVLFICLYYFKSTNH